MKTFFSSIIIADDDEDDIIFLENSLKNLNPSVEILKVRNGLKLMMLMNKHKPDVLFLDINMPVKNGIECLKELKEQNKLDKTRVVIYSTSNNLTEIEQCYNLGANFYFIKPVELTNLELTLNALFNNEDFADNKPPSKDAFVLDYNS